MHTFEQLHSQFQDFLKGNPFEREPKGLYEPIDYIMNMGGKQIRPVLLLMAYNLYQKEVREALAPAYAIELFHSFSLLHDDVMDEADVRRGNPTVHIKYDTNTAILSGDVMLIYVYQYLTKFVPEKHLAEVLTIFNKVAIEVCEGQQMDMDFETSTSVEIEAYLEMIALKTAVLIAAALQIGAIMGGAAKEDAEHLYHFGKNIGIAFQIQDDHLDTFGDPILFGKKIGGDIVQNKKTYLYLKARQEATKEELALLDAYYADDKEDEKSKIAAVTAIFKKLGVDQMAEELKEKYQKIAFEHLSKVSCPSINKQPLTKLAERLMGRKV